MTTKLWSQLNAITKDNNNSMGFDKVDCNF